LILCMLIGLIGCSEDVEDQNIKEDPLLSTQLLGEWEISSRSYNGITPLIRFCCEYLSLEEDAKSDDLKGVFSYSGGSQETNGIFDLDTINGTISFSRENSNSIYTYNTSNGSIAFYFREDDVDVEEVWVKKE